MLNKIICSPFLYLTLLIIFYSSCNNTPPIKNHIIEGVIKNYEGKIYLVGYATPKYYFDNAKRDSSFVVNGKFEFKLAKENKYPLLFSLVTENNLRTNRFILEPKNQKIIVDSLYFNVKPKIIVENSTLSLEEEILKDRDGPFMEKFRESISAIMNSDAPKDSYRGLFDIEREKLIYKTDSLLVDFVKEYPNSYFSFWEIVSNLFGHGYTREIEIAYNNLSPLIKETKVGKLFLEDIKTAKLVHPGNYFPEINLKNRDLGNLVLKVNEYSDSPYILVDFWFIYCSPCIAQFPRLKDLYSKFNPEGLEIIGISIDKTSNIDSWNKTINKHEIKWINLLDENGVESIKLSINKFPTNFLLNRQGEILQKDVSLEELEEILKNIDREK